MSEGLIGPERRAEILANVMVDGGKPTDSDLVEIMRFKEFMVVSGLGIAAGLSEKDSVRLASGEVYGQDFTSPLKPQY